MGVNLTGEVAEVCQLSEAMDHPMNRKHLWVVLAGVLASPFLSAQQYIRITIPRRAELTPVQRLNREGVDHVLKHRYEKAEALFYKAYLYDPSDPFTLNNLGYVSELQGQVDRAAEYYRLAVEQGCEAVIDRSSEKDLKGKPMMDALGTIKNMPMRINRINIYAMQLLQQNRAFDAEAVLKQTLSLDPNNPFTLNNLGIAEQATGNLEDALKYYEAAARTHSTQQVVVALDKSSRGKPISTLAAESAEKLRARMADMDIHQIRAHMFTVRGVSALNKEDWATARSNFEQAYAADPSSAFTLNNIGYLAERDGDLETAVAYYTRARAAKDAGEAVGMASRSEAEGHRLAEVALQSRQDVYQALKSRTPAPVSPNEPVELIRRDGSPEPPPSQPDNPEPAPSSAPLPR